MRSLLRLPRLRSHSRPSRDPKRFVPPASLLALEGRLVMSTAQPVIPEIQPYKVELQWVDISKPGTVAPGQQPQYKLGIYVGLGGDAPRIYEFDTGGEGFWAAYNPNLSGSEQWWGDFKTVHNQNLSIQYSSGNQYLANQTKTTVQLYSALDPEGQAQEQVQYVVGTGQGVDIGQIVKYSDKNQQDVNQWYANLQAGEPPLGGTFYGDFGASLQPIASKQGGMIYSILPQIPVPAGLTPGFRIHAGMPNDPNNTPYLQIGLTQADLQSAETTLMMNRYQGPNGQTFPVTGYSTYSQQVSTANFTWSDGNGHSQTFNNVGWTIDTGATLVNIWQGPNLKVQKRYLMTNKNGRYHKTNGYTTGQFLPGQSFKASATAINPGGKNFLLDIKSTGPTPAKNLVATNYHPIKSMGRNYINTGLLTFKDFDILYNLQGGTIMFDAQSTTT